MNKTVGKFKSNKNRSFQQMISFFMQLAITRLCAKLIIKISNHNNGLKSSVKWEFEDSTYAYL